MKISYLTDTALATLRGQLPDNISCYASGDQGYFYDIIDSMDGFRYDSKLVFPDFELDMSSDYAASDTRNVKTLYSAMRDLPLSVACDERLWVGLAHGYFWDYVQYRQEEQIASRDERKVATSFFFTNGQRRSLYVNCLSRLWWAGYLTYDEDNPDDPFELTDIITKTAFPSTITLFSSSNMTANPRIGLGVLDSLKKRERAGETIKRKYFVGPLRYLNSMGGITVLDILSRSEITNIVDEYLATDEFANLKLVSRKKKDETPESEPENNAAELPSESPAITTGEGPTRMAYDPVIDDIEYYGFDYVDERSSGGALWIVGGDELQEFVEEWRERLVNFEYAERGCAAVRWKPSWWTKDESPE